VGGGEIEGLVELVAIEPRICSTPWNLRLHHRLIRQYSLACNLAMRGRKDEALTFLRAAVGGNLSAASERELRRLFSGLFLLKLSN